MSRKRVLWSLALMGCFAVLTLLIASGASLAAQAGLVPEPAASSSSNIQTIPEAQSEPATSATGSGPAVAGANHLHRIQSHGDIVPVFTYFIPFDDRDLRDMLEASDVCQPSPSTPPTAVGDFIASHVSLTGSEDDTVFYYDHWEDGFDTDPLHPGPTTQVGVLNAGEVRVFSEDIDVTTAPWGSVFHHDGRDRITAAGGRLEVVRSVYPSPVDSDIGARLAGAWEIERTDTWGTQYVVPAGEDYGPGSDFEFTAGSVTALVSGTQVFYNGAPVAALDTGGVHFFAGVGDGTGLRSGDLITATAPVQFHSYASICTSAEWWSGNTYLVEPVEHWDNEYWSPVPNREGCVADLTPGTPDDIPAMNVFFFNNSGADITLHIVDGNAYTVTLPPGPSNLVDLIAPAIPSSQSGFHFYGDAPFWGVVNMATRRWDYEWGVSLLPSDELTHRAVLGWAAGNTDYPYPLQFPPNGNFAWVTPVIDTRVYVDLDEDGNPDLVDCNGDGDAADLGVDGLCDEPTSDAGVPVPGGRVLRVADPFDADLTGALIYTLDPAEKLVVVWGEDPCTAEPARPYLDMGYSIAPARGGPLTEPILWLDKLPSDPATVTPGDMITYTVVVSNVGTATAQNVRLEDELPPWVSYVPGTLDLSYPVTSAITATTFVSRTSNIDRTYGDNFEQLTQALTSGRDGNDGTLTWTVPISLWTEFGDDGDELAGEIAILEDAANAYSPPAYLQLGAPTPGPGGMARCVDLTALLEPRLAFRVQGSAANSGDDFYRVEISPMAVLLREVVSVATYERRDVDLAAYAGMADVCISFIAEEGMDPGDLYRIDNVYVYDNVREQSTTEQIVQQTTEINYVTVSGIDPVAYVRTPGDPEVPAITHTIQFTDAFTFPPQTRFTATFQVHVGVPLTRSLRMTNTAVVTATNLFTRPHPLRDRVPTDVLVASFAMAKERVSPSPVPVGEPVQFLIAITNTGSLSITELPLQDTYDPVYLEFESAEPPPDSGVPGALFWDDLTTLLPGSVLLPQESTRVVVNFIALTSTQHLSPPVTIDVALVEGARTREGELPPDDDDAEVEITPREPTAIELLYLRANPKGADILVEWATLYEIETFGFRLYRGADPRLAGATRIGFIAGQGAPDRGAAYQYLDTGLAQGHYYYWLVEVENGGNETAYGPVDVRLSPSGADQAHRFYLPLLLH